MKKTIFFFFIVILSSVAYAGLTCTTRTDSCLTGETPIINMSNDDVFSRHAALPTATGNAFKNVVCCSGASGTDCSATNAVQLFNLSKDYDSHIWLNWPWLTPSPVPACISGQGLACGIVTNTSDVDGYKVCTDNNYDTCIATASGNDGNIGDCAETTNRFDEVVCCSAAGCDFPGDCNSDCIIDVSEFAGLSTAYTQQVSYSCGSLTYTPAGFINQCIADLKALPYNKYGPNWRDLSTCGQKLI